MKRVTNPKDRHSGQVSFPGGKVEKADRDLAHTALREAEEELGVPQTTVSILGKMTDLYIPVSNFLVHPFIGFTPNKPSFQLQHSEVQQIVEAPLAILLNKANRKTTNLTLPNNVTLKEVPYFDVNGNIVWGATAMMLSEFTAIVKQISSAVFP
jgi:8-oxo-dGTP pyrophosphatase MutT (NUDIX family)